MKESLKLTLKPGTDAFAIQRHLNRYYSRSLKCTVQNETTLLIWFNPERIAAKVILKLVAQVGREQGRSRTPNVISISSYLDEEAA